MSNHHQQSSTLRNVDQRTRLIGENRLEVLLFHLETGPTYAINVFKVQEVQAMLPVTKLPDSPPAIVGVAKIRGETIPVIDLGPVIGIEPIKEPKDAKLIITEYNKSIQAFMVKKVERILNLNWEEVRMPPKRAGSDHYLTAVAYYGDELLEVLDVERVLVELNGPFKSEVDMSAIDPEVLERTKGLKVLVVDDSVVARSQVVSVLDALGIESITASNGAEGLATLKALMVGCETIDDALFMMITDAEMPEMDGYSLASACRKDDKLKDLFIVMHTSLSENLNRALVEQSGCDAFLSKYNPDQLQGLIAAQVMERVPSTS